MLISLILGLLLGAVAVVFALQNITTIAVVFLAWQLQGSLALILIVAVLVGIIISLLISIPEVVKNHFRILTLKKQNKALATELENYKNQAADAEARHTTVVQSTPGQTTTVTTATHADISST